MQEEGTRERRGGGGWRLSERKDGRADRRRESKGREMESERKGCHAGFFYPYMAVCEESVHWHWERVKREGRGRELLFVTLLRC